MNWGVVCRPDAKKSVSLAKTIIEFLSDKGTVYPEQSISQNLETKGYTFQELNTHADIVITIGGDGTILMALHEIEKPIFAINSGGMGFLSEVESKYAIDGLKRVIAGKFNVEERAKLKILVNDQRFPDAANEVTVQTNRIAKIMYLKLFVDGELIENIGADGVIVASPTGSTSYSLSVGGPLMDPAVNAMIIAPLAPFKLSARPWIIPLERKIEIKVLPKSKESKLVIDGGFSQVVSPDDDIMVTGSEKKARFVRFGETFYQMVRVKLIR